MTDNERELEPELWAIVTEAREGTSLIVARLALAVHTGDHDAVGEYLQGIATLVNPDEGLTMEYRTAVIQSVFLLAAQLSIELVDKDML